MSLDPTSLATAAVQKLQPYVPGKPISELEREYGITSSIKLASNENPLGPGPRALAAIANAAQLGLYPDGNGFELKQALARKHGVDIEAITLGNGSNDVLVMVAETFLDERSEAVYSQHGFAVYPIAVQATGATARIAPVLGEGSAMPLGHDLEAMARLVNAKTKVVFIANPNNPTGTWLSAAPLQGFIAQVPPTTLVVVDEAYFEYVELDADYPDASRWLAEFPNLIVTRTFSKAYGLAGLRVGYALSSPAIAALLNRVRQPFNVNSVALAAACAALEDHEHLARSVQLNRASMQQLQEGFRQLGVRSHASRGNFVLIDCGRPSAPVYQAMLRQGVIVRPVGNYQLPNHLRITTGTVEQNQRMLQALQVALKS